MQINESFSDYSHRMQIAFDVQNNWKFSSASDFDDLRSPVIDTGWLKNLLCWIIPNTTLATFVITASINNARIG